MKENYRIVKDSMGEMKVPVTANYGAQTQRAVENFPISGLTMPRLMIKALGLIKAQCAKTNCALGLLDAQKAQAIENAAHAVAQGKHDADFPLDIFQTGSGTSTNMNANEVIANLASQVTTAIHPNDEVNMSQSSNDVIPTAVHVSAALAIHEQLLPALEHLHRVLCERAQTLHSVTKTGRTHLMDAMPITLGQELGAFAAQIKANITQIQQTVKFIHALAIGGTAVGTGINAPPEFGTRVSEGLKQATGIPFSRAENLFAALSCQDPAVALSGQLKTLAVSLMKIANDLRWMNSGPLAGLAEISLPTLQPGSSIMPGKVNPVVCESVMMVCAQVMGNDVTINVSGQAGNFQLNVMLPVIAYNLLQSIEILASSIRMLADKAIAGFTVNEQRINAQLARNPILVTALNTVIGYELGAKIAKTAYEQGEPVLEVAKKMTNLSETQLKHLLDPNALTKGGVPK